MQYLALVISIFAFINSLYALYINLIQCRKLRDELSKAQTEIANLWHQIEYPDDKT